MKPSFRSSLLALALATTQAALAQPAQGDATTASLHQHASSPGNVTHASPLVVSLDTSFLTTLPRESVTAIAHGKTLHCAGIPLAVLLRGAGALDAEALRGPRLASYVLVTARDGYRALFSLAELEPTLGNHRVLLVDRCDDKALDQEDGPLRLIAPGESLDARWVRQVHSITVVTAP
ncbi:MAG: hypothetical protein ABWX93_02040 [Pseudoxanthomonas sp.]